MTTTSSSTIAIAIASADASKLDRFERRFAWFRARLDERRGVWALFPEAWRVPQTLCLTFCKITKVWGWCSVGLSGWCGGSSGLGSLLRGQRVG